jgi:tRNA/rRNA methyltransferase/tRNA (cytidine32/uridine32-2'-O)-methyltransferase
MNLEEVAVILCRPEESGNVGAVCRAMKNMGLGQLRLAGTGCALDEGVILARAVHAGEIWQNAVRFPDLSSALADRAISIGATRRQGARRKDFSLDPREAAACLKSYPGKGALVLGNEKHGLTDAELNLCTLSSHIPANPEFPSLNLSHAFQIYAWELYLALKNGDCGHWVPMEKSRIDVLVRSVTDSLMTLGFYRQKGREEQERFFRDIFSRAGVTVKEGRYIDSIFKKAAKLGLKGGV